ncbi:hypothetical protein LIA77_03656 [Sarocladium implicatum]|nr:hypothetical protein LIA77_03656 [Sarocladium implicatum]
MHKNDRNRRLEHLAFRSKAMLASFASYCIRNCQTSRAFRILGAASRHGGYPAVCPHTDGRVARLRAFISLMPVEGASRLLEGEIPSRGSLVQTPLGRGVGDISCRPQINFPILWD